MSSNPRQRHRAANTTRPGGASALADSEYPPDLILAAVTGNRATRRLARRNLLRAYRREATR